MEAKLQDLETPCIILEQTSLQGNIKYNEGTVVLMVSTMTEKQAWDEQGKMIWAQYWVKEASIIIRAIWWFLIEAKNNKSMSME